MTRQIIPLNLFAKTPATATKITSLMIFILLPLLGVALTFSLSSINFIIPASLSISLLIINLALLWHYRQTIFAEPITFGLISYLGYALGAIYAIFWKDLTLLDLPIEGQALESYLNAGLVLAWVGLVMMFAGYKNKFAYQIGHRFGKKGNPTKISAIKSYFWFLIILFSIVGLAWYLAGVFRAGGLAYIVSNLGHRAEIRARAGFDSTLDQILIHLFPLATTMLFLLVLRYRQSWLTAFFGIHLAVASSILLLQGGRAFVITFWLGLFVIYERCAPKRIPWRRVALICLVILVIGVGLRSYRRVTQKYRRADSELVIHNLVETFKLENFLAATAGWHDLADIHMLTLVIYTVPDQLDYQYGRTFARYPLELIAPGSFPETTGIFLRRALVDPYSKYGIPPSIVGEMYLNFGVLGVIFGMYLFGMFMATLKGISDSEEGVWTDILYSIVLTRFVFMFVRGDFSISFYRTFTYILPVLGIMFLHYLWIHFIRQPAAQVHLSNSIN